MRTIIVIPARYGSSRFPGKPLAQIAGRSMLERVWRIAASTKHRVLIATEDQRIVDAAKQFGAEAVLTAGECRNGTERVSEAVKKVNDRSEVIINLQGDACLTPPWILEAVASEIARDPAIEIATPAVRLKAEEYRAMLRAKERGEVGGTFVVFDSKHNALYFSKSPIPYLREVSESSPLYRHIGIYGYRRTALDHYLSLSETPLEQTEGLEQLRALESGMTVRVVEVDYRGRSAWSVDSPEDLKQVEKIIASEGELL